MIVDDQLLRREDDRCDPIILDRIDDIESVVEVVVGSLLGKYHSMIPMAISPSMLLNSMT